MQIILERNLQTITTLASLKLTEIVYAGDSFEDLKKEARLQPYYTESHTASTGWFSYTVFCIDGSSVEVTVFASQPDKNIHPIFSFDV